MDDWKYILLKSPKSNLYVKTPPLAGVAQWVGCRPAKQKVRSPVRAPAWVAGRVPCWVCARGKQSVLLIDVSLPLFLPSFPSL